MEKTLSEILISTGYATRSSPVDFLDNWNRRFVIKREGTVITITVSGGDQDKFPKLNGVFTVDLTEDRIGNESAPEIQELKKFLEIRPFDEAA